MRVSLILATVLFPCTLLAQGFAGLGTDAEGFAVPQREYAFEFPKDHGAHPDYRIEWWYLTANLEDETGRAFGLQWTLFRSAMAPGEATGWQSPQIWFAHAGLTTPDAHYATERFARGGIGAAGVRADPFHAWIDEWHLSGADFDNLSMYAAGPDFAYDMELIAQGPLIFHGENGFSVKSNDGQASYYYSQPFYNISGTLRFANTEVEVTGTAWLDREWSSQPLSDDQQGWDWFSLSFDDGSKMMGFQLRGRETAAFTSGTWIRPDGTTEAFAPGDLSAQPLAVTDLDGRQVPTAWRVLVPKYEVDVEVHALNPNSWMDLSIAYWEGPVRVSGTHQGRGYLEMTGY